MDGRWRMFDFADGSVLAWDPKTGCRWAVECRAAAEIVVSCNGEAFLPCAALRPLAADRRAA